MRYFKNILLLLAMIMALPMVTACNDDDSVDYTEYYDWRDQNNVWSKALYDIQQSDSALTYFDQLIFSLKEPLSFPSYVHYFRHANLDSLSQLSPRKDYRPFLTSTVSVHYTLYKTQSVYEKIEGAMYGYKAGQSREEALKNFLRNPGGAMDSIFFANADGNTLKADTIESAQVTFFSTTPNAVINGWGDILQNMYIGDNVVCMIPWFIGYGQSGSGKNIDPYTNLFFRIELCDITNWGGTVKN